MSTQLQGLSRNIWRRLNSVLTPRTFEMHSKTSARRRFSSSRCRKLRDSGRQYFPLAWGPSVVLWPWSKLDHLATSRGPTPRKYRSKHCLAQNGPLVLTMQLKPLPVQLVLIFSARTTNDPKEEPSYTGSDTEASGPDLNTWAKDNFSSAEVVLPASHRRSVR